MKRFYFFIATIIIVLSMLNITVYAADEKILTYVNLVGANRYDTSIRVSKEAYPKGTNNIILVNGTTNIDVILAEPLANKLSAPVLRNPKDKLMAEIKNEINRLKPKNAYIIGGTAAMSKNIEVELKAMKINVKRIYGDNRYTTAIAIAKEINSFERIIICNSSNDAQNAMAISAIAAQNKIPILYNDSNTEINTVTYNFIQQYAAKIKTIYMVGNKTSQLQQTYLKSKGISIVNINGKTPYDINVEITKKLGSKSYDKILLVNNPVDAVSVSYFAAKNKCLFLYTDKKLTNNQVNLVKGNNISKIYYLGGGTIKETVDQITRILSTKKKEIVKLKGTSGYLDETRLISNGQYSFPEYHQEPKVGKNYTLYEKINYLKGTKQTLRTDGCNVFASACVVSGLLGDSSVEPISYLKNLKAANIWYANNDQAFNKDFLKKYYGLNSTTCKTEKEMLELFKSKKGKCAAIGYEYNHYIAIIPIMDAPEGYKFYVVDSAFGHTGKYKSGKDFKNRTKASDKSQQQQFSVCAVIYP